MSKRESIKLIEREALEEMYLNALEDSKRLDKLEREIVNLRTQLNTLEYRAAVEV